MFVKEQDNFLVRVHHALGLPIRARCAELTVLLDRGSLLELHSFFPILLESIFGPQGTLSWGLRTTSENCTEDFRQLHHFLSPLGPLFKLIYTLLKDPGTKYDFPLAYLPTKIRQFLENAHQHPFYADLLHVNPQTKQVMSLLLNPFDYYIFHFAYYLINPWHQRTGAGVTSWNTVYYILCCDYILHFLPTDPTIPILPELYYFCKTTIHPMAPNSGLPVTTHLINITALNKSTMDESSFHKNLERHPRNEIWRSETVLMVFTDMWLHNDQISHKSEINNSFNTTTTMRLLHYNELPTGEYMRIIRVLIKQLHSFSASAKADDTALSELKKIAVPMIQGKFYIFLRNLIHKWPLDGSFRLVLELWLTYIQPWRYPANNLIKLSNKRELNPDVDDVSFVASPSVEREFLPFIAENLLSYVVIFQQLLPRFCRVDLVSPKMSLMLYRITKVFDQPNLPNFLQEIEHCVENNNSPSHKYNSHWASSLPPLSPTSNWSTSLSLLNSTSPSQRTATYPSSSNASFLNASVTQNDKKWSAVVRQKIFELEGPNFCYKPLFSMPPAPEVHDLIVQIKKSIGMAQVLLQLKQKEEAELYSSFWGMIKYFFAPTVSSDEFTLSERMKVPAYLEVSLQNLLNMFQISEVVVQDQDSFVATNQTGIDVSNYFKFLTPEHVRSRISKIRYEGDPDLHPIRSTENTFLVRSLYQLALKINEHFSQQFYVLYHENSFWGRLSRQILCPPMTAYRFDKTILGSPRVATNLPPRLSLRFFSTYKFLRYFLFGAGLSWFFDYSFVTYVFLLFAVFVMYKCLRAIPNSSCSPMRHNYPTEGFGNISFNDSF